MVDIWITPEGCVRVLDEDELAACAASGLVSDDELVLIEQQKKLILSSHAAIIAEAIAIETEVNLLKGVLEQ
jgi:hypothetical protein